MIRSWILAIVLMGVTCGVTEARGRSRFVQYHGNSYQSRMPVYYNTGTPQYVAPQYTAPQSYTSGSQQIIQPVSFSSTTNSIVTTNSTVTTAGNSYFQGDSMQAWAEEEARMMASRGTCGHIRPAPMGCFVGVGCGSTCMGSGTLVAEAHYQGKMVRVWRR